MHNKKKLFYFYIFTFFYLILFIGYFFGENSSGGSKYDYEIHLNTVEYFKENFYKSFLNYHLLENSHSPIFIILLKWMLSFGSDMGRFIYLNISAVVPIIFYFSIKEKYKFDNSILLFVLSFFFFLSPYFRSYAIWPGDENISILFFLISIFFYIKIIKKNYKNQKQEYIYLLFNILFLALASYFRPIYSLFSILFFYGMVLERFEIKKFFIYIILSFILSFPAIYYVFILKVNFFYKYIEDSINLSNSLGFSYTVFLFYLLPFIYLYKEKFNFEFHKYNLLASIIFSVIVLSFFNYKILSGGGIFYQAYKLFFTNDSLFWIICAISFLIFNKYINFKLTKNWIILAILVLFEIDAHFYQDSYDPLFLVSLFLLIDSKIIDNFIKNISFKKISILFFYLLVFWTIKCINYYLILDELKI